MVKLKRFDEWMLYYKYMISTRSTLKLLVGLIINMITTKSPDCLFNLSFPVGGFPPKPESFHTNMFIHHLINMFIYIYIYITLRAFLTHNWIYNIYIKIELRYTLQKREKLPPFNDVASNNDLCTSNWE